MSAFWNWLKSLFSKKEEAPYVPPVVVYPHPPAPKPVEVKPVTPTNPIAKPIKLEDTCPAPGVFHAVDLSQYCDQHFLTAMKQLGVKTIIRYYDWPGSPTLREKIPTPAELALIKANGFQFCAVFQHNNSKLASFTAARGKHDAGVALDLAKKWGQPKGTAIYFGVDFDPSLSEITHDVMDYAREFGKLVRAAGFRVGAYGSGLTLETLMAGGYIELTWLSMSTGFRRSKEFAATGKWNLKQVKDRDCGGINVDFDYVNPNMPDFGQWKLP